MIVIILLHVYILHIQALDSYDSVTMEPQFLYPKTILITVLWSKQYAVFIGYITLSQTPPSKRERVWDVHQAVIGCTCMMSRDWHDIALFWHGNELTTCNCSHTQVTL